MKQNIPLHQLPFFDDTVEETYPSILKCTQQLLSTIERDELRCYYERKGGKSKC